MSAPTYTVALTADERALLLAAMQREAEGRNRLLASQSTKPTPEEGNAIHAYRMRIAQIATLEQDRSA